MLIHLTNIYRLPVLRHSAVSETLTVNKMCSLTSMSLYSPGTVRTSFFALEPGKLRSQWIKGYAPIPAPPRTVTSLVPSCVALTVSHLFDLLVCM